MSNTFEPIGNRSVISQFLVNAKKNLNSVVVWESDPASSIQSFILETEPLSGELKLSRPSGSEISEWKIVRVSISLRSAVIVFKSRILRIDATSFTICGPEQVFRVQRRKNQRVNCLEQGASVILETDGDGTRLPERRIIDLNSQGASVLIFPEDATRFHENQEIDSIQLLLGAHVIEIRGTVKYCEPFQLNQSVNMVKLGFEFISPSLGARGKIEDFLLHQVRAEFSSLNLEAN